MEPASSVSSSHFLKIRRSFKERVRERKNIAL